MREAEAIGPFKVFTPCGGCFQGIESLSQALRKAKENEGSKIVDSAGVVVYTNETPSV